MFQLVVITYLISASQAQLDTAVHQTLKTELMLSQNIKNHVEQLTKMIRRVERRTGELLSLRWTELDKSDYVTTPLSAMVMVRRLLQDWLPLATMVSSYSRLSGLPLADMKWPMPDDLAGAARAVKRSQLTYDLSTALLVRGKQGDMFLGTNVTAADCFEIGRQFFLREHYPEAVEWLRLALNDVTEQELMEREKRLYYTAAALCFAGDTESSINVIRGILKENPLSKPPDDLSEYLNIMGTQGCVYPDEKVLKLLNKKYESSSSAHYGIYFNRNKTTFDRHSKLCRGEGHTDNKLVCRYVHHNQPHLRLQPFKLEELQLDPPVVRFHDLISDGEAQLLIREGKKKMMPATVGLGGERTMSDYRTSHVAWLPSNRSDWLTVRISEATRLDAAFAEIHQLSRYSVAGEYLPHTDAFGSIEAWFYDRIATVMFYLNDVEQGGHTIFLSWGLSVKPVKNSAILWFNFKPDGEEDWTTDHSGCPVLKGTKWVLNKWIYNGGPHPINYPCTLENKGSFKGFYL